MMTTWQWLIVYPLTKGITMGAIVVGVVNSGLSQFAQALIISIVSAVVGALGLIVASLISANAAKEAQHAAERTESHVVDLKRSVGADKRSADRRGEHDDDSS